METNIFDGNFEELKDEHKYCERCGKAGLVYREDGDIRFKCERMLLPHDYSLTFEEVIKGA